MCITYSGVSFENFQINKCRNCHILLYNMALNVFVLTYLYVDGILGKIPNIELFGAKVIDKNILSLIFTA